MSSSKNPESAVEGPRSWIFQADPQVFDLAEALKHIKRFRWSVHQYGKEVKVGDNFCLCISGGNGGLFAKGEVVSNPAVMKLRDEELPFVVDIESLTTELRADIEVRQEIVPHPSVDVVETSCFGPYFSDEGHHAGHQAPQV